MATDRDLSPTGSSAAALVAAGLGLLALALSHLAAEASAGVKEALQALGNAWMPGAAGIGPYSGKETVGLLVWFGMWALLRALWRRREISLVSATVWLLALTGAATTLLWPPVLERLLHA